MLHAFHLVRALKFFFCGDHKTIYKLWDHHAKVKSWHLMKCMDCSPEWSNYSIYRGGICPQISFPIPSLRNTWPASSIYQGNTIIHPVALSSCFPSPTFCWWKMNLSTVGQQQRSNPGGLRCRWDHFCTCGVLWQHKAPLGLPGSSAAWLMNLYGRKSEGCCLAKH